MAKGRKTGGRDFVPGDLRAGRPPMPDDLKTAKRLTRGEFELVANKFLWLSEQDFRVAAADPDCTMIEKMVGSIIARGILDGDHVRLNFLLDRLVGKVKDEVEVTVAKPYLVNHLDGTKTEVGAKLEKKE